MKLLKQIKLVVLFIQLSPPFSNVVTPHDDDMEVEITRVVKKTVVVVNESSDSD